MKSELWKSPPQYSSGSIDMRKIGLSGAGGAGLFSRFSTCSDAMDLKQAVGESRVMITSGKRSHATIAIVSRTLCLAEARLRAFAPVAPLLQQMLLQQWVTPTTRPNIIEVTGMMPSASWSCFTIVSCGVHPSFKHCISVSQLAGERA